MTEAMVSPEPAPYTLVQIEQETSFAIPKLSVSWDNLCFTVKIKNPTTKKLEEKSILKGVSGEAHPGELMVLMGPSGAGKSSLLDCIANRNPLSTGKVLVNGQPWTPSTIKRSCYVMQDDLFYANLTVREHLNFQAQLRMGGSFKKRNTRVTQIISELGLNKVMNTPIGDVHVKGLSGGQRKRVTFATELLTNPSILFVDEPTSGLDSFMAETVVKLMRQLAGKGRTVIATIHQPASDLFELFDKLYLLSDGRTVYNGPARTSIEYFASQGYACPTFINPTDYFMKQLVVTDQDPNSKARVQGLIDAWAANHSDDQPKSAWVNQTEIDAVPFVEPSGYGSFAALGVLCRRNLFRLVRDIVGFRARIVSTIVVSLVSGLVFLQLKVSQTGIQDFTGAIFFLSVNQFMFSANPEFITVPLEIPLVIREHNGGLYHVLVWYLSKNVSELPFQTFFPMLFLIPTFFLIGFTANATTFFTMYMFIVLAASSAVGLGYMVSCLSKRVDLAPTIGILFILPFMLFGGLFLNSESTPDYFIWLERISPIKYTFHGIMRAWWSQVSVIPCPPQANGQPGRCRNTSGTDVLMNNHIDVDGLWKDALCLVGINLSFRVLGAFFLWKRARQRNL